MNDLKKKLGLLTIKKNTRNEEKIHNKKNEKKTGKKPTYVIS